MYTTLITSALDRGIDSRLDLVPFTWAQAKCKRSNFTADHIQKGRHILFYICTFLLKRFAPLCVSCAPFSAPLEFEALEFDCLFQRLPLIPRVLTSCVLFCILVYILSQHLIQDQKQSYEGNRSR